VSTDVIVEIRVDVSKPVSPASNFVRPVLQQVIGIISCVTTARSVKANVARVRRQFLCPRLRVPVMKAQRYIVLLQLSENFLRIPGIVAKFDCIRIVLGEDIEKVAQSAGVRLPFGRKLEKYRPEMWSQVPCTRKEKIDGILCVFQALHVRQKAAGLYREQKARGDPRCPLSKRFFVRESIEGVINFDSVKLPRVPLQHFGRRKLGRVEIAEPMFVMPS
jgi:hypothetical protein